MNNLNLEYYLRSENTVLSTRLEKLQHDFMELEQDYIQAVDRIRELEEHIETLEENEEPPYV